MRSAWVGATVAAALLSAACGEGRVIFNIDVLSFLAADQVDTVYYLVPGGSATVDNPPVEATILDLAGAVVESVTVTTAAVVANTAGSGRVKFQIFFGADSATLYAGTPYAQDSAVVSGAQTDTLAPGPIPLGADSVFSNEKLWIGVRVSVVTTSPPVQGTLRLSQLRLRVVMNDDEVL